MFTARHLAAAALAALLAAGCSSATRGSTTPGG
jgi:outer membrane murein-binding lipoprotein Lpp